MTIQTYQLTDEAIKAMPKIDLHRHFEGSLRLPTLLEIARKYSLDLPAHDIDGLRPHVQITDDPPDPDVFLGKFHVLRHFYRSPEAIQQLAYEVVADAALDNIHYLELRFSPQAQARVRGFPLEDVTDWVIEAAQQAAHDFNIQVGLIISLVRHEPLEQARQVAEIAFARRHKGIVGLDLAGDEVKYHALPFQSIFRDAKEAGLGITIHAGEWTDAEKVRHAVEYLKADRIGHGIHAVESSEVLQMLKTRNISLEVCLTSNVQTGVVQNLEHHPLVDLLDLGVMVTLNTDDPSVSDCTLSDEYAIAVKRLGLTYATLRQLLFNAANTAFLPLEKQKELLLVTQQKLSEFEATYFG